MDKLTLLEDLADEVRVCPKCRLAETRTHAVPGEGSARARIMFVGEGPGENEDKTGRPFVGRAGQLLNRLFDGAGIERSDVFITNTVKCRPPANREPMPDEIEACSDYLMAQIAIIEPEVICPLGNPALRTLVGPHFSIGKARGKLFRKNGVLFFPIFHPAFALRREEFVQTLQDDMIALKALLGREIRDEEVTELPGLGEAAKKGKKDEPPESGNLSLF